MSNVTESFHNATYDSLDDVAPRTKWKSPNIIEMFQITWMQHMMHACTVAWCFMVSACTYDSSESPKSHAHIRAIETREAKGTIEGRYRLMRACMSKFHAYFCIWISKRVRSGEPYPWLSPPLVRPPLVLHKPISARLQRRGNRNGSPER